MVAPGNTLQLTGVWMIKHVQVKVCDRHTYQKFVTMNFFEVVWEYVTTGKEEIIRRLYYRQQG